MQNSSERCTQWYANGPKMAIFGHKWPQRPPVAGKSGINGGSLWNTCGGTTEDAKLVRKMQPMVWKWPKNGQFLAKNIFLAIRSPRGPRWMVKDAGADHTEAHPT